MQIRVLGCSGSIAAGSRTTSFLLDDDVLIDAGTGVGDLSLQELARIDHILVTHSHLDHVLSIGLLADSVTRKRHAAGRPPVRVHALPATIAALRLHIFNLAPPLRISPGCPIRPSRCWSSTQSRFGQVLQLGLRRIEVLASPPHGAGGGLRRAGTARRLGLHRRHRAQSGTVGTPGQPADGPADHRTAFRDDEQELARLSQHLCPAELLDELAQLEQRTQVCITHIKPGELEAVMAEVGRLDTRHHIRALMPGQVMDLGPAG